MLIFFKFRGLHQLPHVKIETKAHVFTVKTVYCVFFKDLLYDIKNAIFLRKKAIPSRNLARSGSQTQSTILFYNITKARRAF